MTRTETANRTAGQTSGAQHLKLICNRPRSFARAEDGGMAIVAFFVFLLMITMGSLSIDLMRHEMERTKLQATLDSAVLAAANLNKQQDPDVIVDDFFTKAGMSHALDDIETTDWEALINSRSIGATASFDVDTYLMRLMGVDTLAVRAGSGAAQAIEDIEVSLVLDISGSMRFGDRMGDLKPAAREFVTTLLTGEASWTTSISLIPYAGQVNPGPTMFSRLGGIRYGTTGGDYFPSTPATEKTVLYYDRDLDDSDVYDYVVMIDEYGADPGELIDKNDIDTYLYFADAYARRHSSELESSDSLYGVSSIYDSAQSTAVLSQLGVDTGTSPVTVEDDADQVFQFSDFHDEVIPQHSSCIEMDVGDFNHTGLPNTGSYEQVAHFMNWDIAADVMDWGWCPEDDTAIQYAQNSETALHTFIDGMRMHDGTGTHYGIKYALALLDPSSNDDFIALNAAGLVPNEFANRPLPFNNTEVQKIIVLMTDGKVTEQVRPIRKYDPDLQTEELNNNRSNRTNLTSRSTNVSSFDSVCDAAKANGVTIYTIAFETDDTGRQEMRRCATSVNHYFPASQSDIGDVFATIAAQITQLRLTQ